MLFPKSTCVGFWNSMLNTELEHLLMLERCVIQYCVNHTLSRQYVMKLLSLAPIFRTRMLAVKLLINLPYSAKFPRHIIIAVWSYLTFRGNKFCGSTTPLCSTHLLFATPLDRTSCLAHVKKHRCSAARFPISAFCFRVNLAYVPLLVFLL